MHNITNLYLSDYGFVEVLQNLLRTAVVKVMRSLGSYQIRMIGLSE